MKLSELRDHPDFVQSVSGAGPKSIATVTEPKAAGIQFYPNPKGNKGIPQETPISASLSNLYMMEFDLSARSYCDEIGAFYRRYSDDILVICQPDGANAVEEKITTLLSAEQLEVSTDKTEMTFFAPEFGTVAGADLAGKRCAQYLGFT